MVFALFVATVQLLTVLGYNWTMDAAKANEIVRSLTVADILKVYSGKPGCACGCNGNYNITAESRKEADKDRGYPYDDEDVNPKQVKRVLKQVQQHAAQDGRGQRCEADYFEDHNDARGDVFWHAAPDLQYIIYQAHERRTYCIYLTSAARRRLGVQEGFALQ